MVELTKREAEIIGEKRWEGKNGKRYLLWAGVLALAALGAAVGSTATDASTSRFFWDSGTVSLVLFVATCVLMVAAFFAIIRFSSRQSKAGKAFVKSLKEEPEK